MPTGVLRTNPESLADRPVGTSSYKLVEWINGHELVYDALDLCSQVHRRVLPFLKRSSTDTQSRPGVDT
jgi:hypothetical protein